MSKKDYELIAESIRLSLDDLVDFGYSTREQEAATETAEHLVNNLASALAQANARFDRERFLKACGL